MKRKAPCSGALGLREGEGTRKPGGRPWSNTQSHGTGRERENGKRDGGGRRQKTGGQ